jgi:hypothetical protein
VGGFSGAHDKVGGFDVAVDKVLGVDELDAGYLLEQRSAASLMGRKEYKQAGQPKARLISRRNDGCTS